MLIFTPMKVMKNRILLGLLVSLFFLFPTYLRGEVKERIVALVNNEVITL